jgi:integrase
MTQTTQTTRGPRGAGRIYQRGDVFWIQYSYRGRKVRESSGSEKRTGAVKLLRKRLAEMGTGRLVGPDADRTTFDDLADMVVADYQLNGRRSTRRAKEGLARLRAFFTFARVPDVTSDRVTAYVRHRQDDGAAAATIKYELAILKRAFKLAIAAGKAAQAPSIPSVTVDNARQGFFEAADFEAVERHLTPPLRPFMRFLYFTGWRAGEALGLTWAGVDFAAGVVRLEPGTTKNREGREFPFAALPPLADLLRAQRDLRSAVERKRQCIVSHVFHRNGKPIRSYSGAWDVACEKAGQPGRLVHDLRRTAVRNLERAGVSRSVAMKLTGHKTEAVYRRYAITSASDLAEGVAKLAALHQGVPPLNTRRATRWRRSG